ncbi:MAG: hypothetical protein ACJ71P_05890 [Nitrososphaeraceae archaeon]
MICLILSSLRSSTFKAFYDSMSSFRNNFKEFFEVEESLKNSDVDIIEVQHLNGYEATYYAPRSYF